MLPANKTSRRLFIEQTWWYAWIVEEATVDIWQANATERYRHPHDSNPAPLEANFQGWAIVQSNPQGSFNFLLNF